MNADAYNDLRRIIREELRSMRLAELAVVQEVHPHAGEDDDDNFACTVRMRDSDMVLKRVPVLVARKGMASIPDVGDLVMVQFLGGDPNAPIITGSLYNDEDRPPVNVEGESVVRLPSDAGEGEGIELRLKSGEETSAALYVGSSLKVDLKDDDPVVHINVGDGSAELKIESDGTVTLISGGAINIEGGDIALKGTTITAEADGEMTLKGSVINLN